MLHVEQANREYTTNSLWWLNNLQEMFFLILSHLPINHIVKCRLVCHAWSSWALHDLVWSRHVERITSFYPFFKSEFVDVLPNQTVGPGRSVEYDVPAKRRKAGGKRKVASKKTQEMPKSGRWFAVKKFLNDRFAMEKAQIFQAVGDYDVKYEKRLLYVCKKWSDNTNIFLIRHNIGAAVPTIKFCWVGTTKKNVFKEFVCKKRFFFSIRVLPFSRCCMWPMSFIVEEEETLEALGSHGIL